MQVDITVSGLKELQASLKDFSERRLRSTIATAITRTAVAVRSEMQREMAGAINRPTNYTTRNLRYTAANAKSLQASVGFDIVANQDMYGRATGYTQMGAGQTPVGKYMHDQIHGGPRRNKRFEIALQRVGILKPGWYAVPGKRAKLDSYGNQSPGEIRQILSWFDAAELVAGSSQNMRREGRAKRAQGTARRAGWEYHVIRPGQVVKRTWARNTSAAGPSRSRGSHKMQPGIYRVTRHAMGNQIEPIMIFVQSAGYRPRFDFYGSARRAVDRIYPQQVERAILEARQAMAAKSGGRP